MCPKDRCVSVFSYLSCLIGSVLKCLCDCDTLCLCPLLEVRGQANKVNVSSCRKDQHQHLESKCPSVLSRGLARGSCQLRLISGHPFAEFTIFFLEQQDLDTCTRPFVCLVLLCILACLGGPEQLVDGVTGI